MNKWKIIARHKWVSEAIITESINETEKLVRFTATIFGWRNWKIWEGKLNESMISQYVQQKVMGIRDKIKSGDEEIFNKEIK